jgi:hypothetical protein
LGSSNHFKIGATLAGCNNDMRSMYKLYNDNFPRFDFRAFQEGRFTKKLLMQCWMNLLRTANPGEPFVITLSCHGVVVPLNGVNHTANVMYDSSWDDILNTFLTDEDIKWLAVQHPQQKFFITSDSCESANMAFKFADVPAGVESRNRFVHAPDDVQMEIDHNGGSQKRAAPIVLPNVAYISGTGGKGYYSADVGRYPDAYGLFTRTFSEVFKRGMTANEIAAACRAKMPADQQPEAHGGLKDEPWVMA